MLLLDRRNLVVFAFLLGIFLMVICFNRPVESARRYEYHVVSITGMKELRMQSDAEQGRMKTIENVINEQAAQGWEFYQADGYVLYFRR
jgi:Domain of unknown function (DUF4177)